MACTTHCQQNCSRTCAETCDNDCSRTCSGCRGSCSGCSGCSGTCSGSCTGCTGSCSGSCTSCTGSCVGSCIGTCTGKCNTACTAEAQAEVIANLGLNIAVGHPIRASDYTQIKSAIDSEYIRRGKNVPSALSPDPTPKGSIQIRTVLQVLQDLYALDNLPEHDWRTNFSAGKVIAPSKWAPAIAYLKTLAAEIL